MWYDDVRLEATRCCAPATTQRGQQVVLCQQCQQWASGGGTGVIWDCIEQLGVGENDVLTQSVRSLCSIGVASHAAGAHGFRGADAGCVIASGHGDGRLKMWQIGAPSAIAQADGHFNDERDSAVTQVLSVTVQPLRLQRTSQAPLKTAR